MTNHPIMAGPPLSQDQAPAVGIVLCNPFILVTVGFNVIGAHAGLNAMGAGKSISQVLADVDVNKIVSFDDQIAARHNFPRVGSE
jgi:hypothetical protein